jgi:hypothetical protein
MKNSSNEKMRKKVLVASACAGVLGRAKRFKAFLPIRLLEGETDEDQPN